MARKPIINCHCHLLNLKCIPDKMTKLLSHIPEKFADDDWLSLAAGVLYAVIPGPKYNRIQRFLRILKAQLQI